MSKADELHTCMPTDYLKRYVNNVLFIIRLDLLEDKHCECKVFGLR